MAARTRGNQINVEVDPSGVLDLTRTLRDKLPDIAGGIAAEIGRDAEMRMRQELVRQGSDVTGKGKASLDTVKMGRGSRAVVGNYYLWIVDQGSPPHYPDTSTNRFKIWAETHGFTVDELAEVIARKGTEPHLCQDLSLPPTTLIMLAAKPWLSEA